MRLNIILIFILCKTVGLHRTANRNKRYLLTPEDSQWGVFVTLSTPLHPHSLTSVAWYFQASYYGVSNSSYWHPLLGDVMISRNRKERDTRGHNTLLTRKLAYQCIEALLEKHGFPGRACLLRAICESSSDHFLHNGLLGDVIHIILTPSTSEPEDEMEDIFYEAEYRGTLQDCSYYSEDCLGSPLDYLSAQLEDL